MYTFKTGIDASEMDHFAQNSDQVNLLQSSNWAKVKDNWASDRLGFYKDQQLVASASVLIKPLPFGFSMLYIPRGPIMDYADKELVAYVISALKKYGKRKRALFIKFDPALLLRQYKLTEAKETAENSQTLTLLDKLLANHVEWTGRTRTIADSVQPRVQANVYTQAEITETFPKHTKRLMKDAQNRGVVTYRATIADLDDFYQVVALTEDRKGIALRNKAYFKKLMEIYGNDAYLHLAKVNLAERLKLYQEQLEQIESDLAQTEPHQKKRLTKLEQQKKSVSKYISELTGYVANYPEQLVIAGILSIKFGPVMEMLYAGMNDDFKKFYPQYSLYPKVFQDAYQDGIIWANMGGVEGSLDDGLTKFKANFNPTFEEYIGEFNIPVNSLLYKISNYAYKVRKKLRHKH